MLYYPASEDTYLLEDAIRENRERDEDARVIVEVGCGSGHISKVLRKMYPGSFVISTDVNPHAVEASRRAMDEDKGRSGRNGDVVRTSLMEGISKERVGMAVFNPPYLPSERKHLFGDWIDRSWAGGVDGREVIDQFIAEAQSVPLIYLLV